MNIAGFVKTSFVDYPGKIAFVVFTQGCNLRCGYCHNVNLLDREDTANCILPEEIFKWLAKREGLIDSVVVSGGEPTLQKDLAVFIKELKGKKLLVKLDTNGTNPDRLRILISEKLVDFIAMDLKAPLGKYEKITGTSRLDLPSIQESAEVIKNSGLAYEFRTTLCPELEVDDLPRIMAEFEIDSSYVVQNCRSPELKKVFRSKQDLRRLVQWAETNPSVVLRGFEVG